MGTMHGARQRLQQVFEVQSFGPDTAAQSFRDSFIALSMIRCLNSAQTCAISGVSSAQIAIIYVHIKTAQQRTITSIPDLPTDPCQVGQTRI